MRAGRGWRRDSVRKSPRRSCHLQVDIQLPSRRPRPLDPGALPRADVDRGVQQARHLREVGVGEHHPHGILVQPALGADLDLEPPLLDHRPLLVLLGRDVAAQQLHVHLAANSGHAVAHVAPRGLGLLPRALWRHLHIALAFLLEVVRDDENHLGLARGLEHGEELGVHHSISLLGDLAQLAEVGQAQEAPDLGAGVPDDCPEAALQGMVEVGLEAGPDGVAEMLALLVEVPLRLQARVPNVGVAGDRDTVAVGLQPLDDAVFALVEALERHGVGAGEAEPRLAGELVPINGDDHAGGDGALVEGEAGALEVGLLHCCFSRMYLAILLPIARASVVETSGSPTAPAANRASRASLFSSTPSSTSRSTSYLSPARPMLPLIFIPRRPPLLRRSPRPGYLGRAPPHGRPSSPRRPGRSSPGTPPGARCRRAGRIPRRGPRCSCTRCRSLGGGRSPGPPAQRKRAQIQDPRTVVRSPSDTPNQAVDAPPDQAQRTCPKNPWPAWPAKRLAHWTSLRTCTSGCRDFSSTPRRWSAVCMSRTWTVFPSGVR